MGQPPAGPQGTSTSGFGDFRVWVAYQRPFSLAKDEVKEEVSVHLLGWELGFTFEVGGDIHSTTQHLSVEGIQPHAACGGKGIKGHCCPGG